MATFEFDRNAYLQRINYSGETTPTSDTLRALHHAQLYNIPFENFDIQLGRGIDLAPGAIFDKLILQRRGGYCFELNGLFLMALQAFGFDVRPLLGRVHITGTPTGRGHQIELVTIAGKQWIADVGFGASTPRTPIPLEMDSPASYDGQTVRLVNSDPWGIMLQELTGEEWTDLYSFDLSHVCQADIEYGNHFTSTHPSSLFVFARVAMLPVEGGVLTLFNNMFKRSIAGRNEEVELEDGQPYLDALKSHFGIELDAPYESLLPLPEM